MTARPDRVGGSAVQARPDASEPRACASGAVRASARGRGCEPGASHPGPRAPFLAPWSSSHGRVLACGAPVRLYRR